MKTHCVRGGGRMEIAEEKVGKTKALDNGGLAGYNGAFKLRTGTFGKHYMRSEQHIRMWY
jgi:hypothetical protein